MLSDLVVRHEKWRSKKMRLLDLIHSEPFFFRSKNVMSYLLDKRFHLVTICSWIRESVYYYYIASVCIILPMIHWGLLRRIKTTVMICVIKAESLQPTLRARKNQHELIQFETSFYLQSLKPETLIKGVSVIFDSLWATDSMSTQGFISQITISPNFQTSHMIASYKRYVPCSSSASADPYRCDF